MLSLSYINAQSRKAAARAARLNLQPFLVEQEDINHWKRHGLPRSGFPFPNIGSHQPPGWRKVDELFCDHSGFGAPDEPALTWWQLLERLKPGFGYAVIEVGQFQCYVGVFERCTPGRMVQAELSFAE